MVSTRAVPSSTYRHWPPIALRYKGLARSATAYEPRTSSLASSGWRPRTGSAPVAASLWVWKWRGLSGGLATLALTGARSNASAARIAVGGYRWYSSDESLEKPSWPISSSAYREPSGWRNWV